MPRWRASARTRGALVALLCIALGTPQRAQDASAPPPLTLVSKDGRRTVPTVMSNGRELIALDDIAMFFQVAVREDALAGGFTLSYRGKTIVASADQPMASVDGRIVTLPSPVVRYRPALAGSGGVSAARARADLRPADRPASPRPAAARRRPARAARRRANRLGGSANSGHGRHHAATPVTITTEAGRLVMRVEADALEPVFPVRRRDCSTAFGSAINRTLSLSR